MSNKQECPSCKAWTSAVWDAEHGRCDSCPSCGLSGAIIREVYETRRRQADEELTGRYEQAIVRAGRAEAEVKRLRGHLDAIFSAVQQEFTDYRSLNERAAAE